MTVTFKQPPGTPLTRTLDCSSNTRANRAVGGSDVVPRKTNKQKEVVNCRKRSDSSCSLPSSSTFSPFTESTFDIAAAPPPRLSRSYAQHRQDTTHDIQDTSHNIQDTSHNIQDTSHNIQDITLDKHDYSENRLKPVNRNAFCYNKRQPFVTTGDLCVSIFPVQGYTAKTQRQQNNPNTTPYPLQMLRRRGGNIPTKKGSNNTRNSSVSSNSSSTNCSDSIDIGSSSNTRYSINSGGSSNTRSSMNGGGSSNTRYSINSSGSSNNSREYSSNSIGGVGTKVGGCKAKSDANRRRRWLPLSVRCDKIDQFLYTKLCPYIHTVEGCRRQNRCPYAHTMMELRPRPNLEKTAMCKMGTKARCNDLNCKYAHSLTELRHTHAFYKTTICRFWKSGFCSLGDQCRHAHGRRELHNTEETCSVGIVATSEAPIIWSEETQISVHGSRGCVNHIPSTNTTDQENSSMQDDLETRNKIETSPFCHTLQPYCNHPLINSPTPISPVSSDFICSTTSTSTTATNSDQSPGCGSNSILHPRPLCTHPPSWVSGVVATSHPHTNGRLLICRNGTRLLLGGGSCQDTDCQFEGNGSDGDDYIRGAAGARDGSCCYPTDTIACQAYTSASESRDVNNQPHTIIHESINYPMSVQTPLAYQTHWAQSDRGGERYTNDGNYSLSLAGAHADDRCINQFNHPPASSAEGLSCLLICNWAFVNGSFRCTGCNREPVGAMERIEAVKSTLSSETLTRVLQSHIVYND